MPENQKGDGAVIEVLVIMNNYLHDVATAFLASSALLMLAAVRLLPKDAGAKTIDYFELIYRKFTLAAKAALVWIIIGGIPRVIFFKKIEWTVALDNRIIPALMVKHGIMFLLVLIGIFSWWRLSEKVSKIDTKI
jgi:hypothetical protein